MNNQKIKKTSGQKHIFQVHTMDTDNTIKTNQISKNQTVPLPKTSQVSKGQNILQRSVSQSKKSKQQTSNPFLTDNVSEDTNMTKGSFAPGVQDNVVEKINQTPADIVSQDKLNDNVSGNNQKKMIHIIMIVFIILFIIGIVGFGIYMLKFNEQQSTDNQNILVNTDNMDSEKAKDNPDNNVNVSTDIDKTVNKADNDTEESIEQTYTTKLPNYFSIDVESATVQQDIATELKSIAQNMQQQNITGPISFIVTDQNSNPVSFHIFSMSAGMNIPQDIAKSLEEEFEIYAYNDQLNGIRFGFSVDVKDVKAIQTAIVANEMNLPKSFSIILDNMNTNVKDVVFKDSSYKTHPIRYYNLNKTESYSIDYTISDGKWIIGTTKNTLRVIIDYINKMQSSKDAKNL